MTQHTSHTTPTPTPTPANIPTELAAFINHAWAQLTRATKDRKHPFHLITAATIDEQCLPSLRTVVLRHADQDTRTLRFHTDARSPKTTHITSNARLAILAYDTKHKLQIRINATARVERNTPEADRAWSNTKLMSRRCYLAPSPPSQQTEHWDPNLPHQFITTNPTEPESQPGRENFAIVVATAQRLDVLHIAHDGHRRAAATYTPDNEHLQWLTP